MRTHHSLKTKSYGANQKMRIKADIRYFITTEGSVVSWNTTEVSCNFFWRDSWDWNPIWFSFRGQNHDTGITEPCAAALVGWAGIRRFSRIRQVQCFRKGTVGSTPWQLARARSNAARGTSKFEKTQPRLKIAQLKWIR